MADTSYLYKRCPSLSTDGRQCRLAEGHLQRHYAFAGKEGFAGSVEFGEERKPEAVAVDEKGKVAGNG